MKKTSLILTVSLLLASLSGQVRAQAPLTAYKTTVATGETYHSLSSTATVLWEPTATDTLNRVLPLISGEKVKIKTTSTMGEKAKYPVNVISFGGDALFGKNKFQSAAMTADGFLFFGGKLKSGDAGDSIYVSVNVENFSYMTQAGVNNFIYSAFFNNRNVLVEGGESSILMDKEAVLLGGENAKIGFEKSGDVLYFCYENIAVCDTLGHKAVISWNYGLNPATGEIVLQTKDFNAPTGEKANPLKYSFALYASALQDVIGYDALWLSSWDGGTYQYESKLILDNTSRPEDKTYHFNAPEPCAKISSFEISGDVTVEADMLGISGLQWSDGQNALFVLSKEATLSGNNLPQDGTVYSDNDQIGSSVGIRKGYYVTFPGGVFPMVSGSFYDLEAATQYYIHAFVYNDSCSGGVKYSDAKVLPYTTYLNSPAQDLVSLSGVPSDSVKVILPAAPQDMSYVVALSQYPLFNENGEAYPAQLENGKEYTPGEEVNSLFTIKEAGVQGGTYTVKGMEKGRPFYIGVWYKKGSGETVSYSYRPVVLQQRAVTSVPALIDFSEDMLYTQPAGWEISKTDGRYAFEVLTYGQSDAGGVAPMSIEPAPVPGQGTNILASQLYITDMNIQEQAMSACAITPWFEAGKASGVGAILKIGFYTRVGGNESPESPYRLKAGDSVIISWAGEDTVWNRLAKLDHNSEWGGDAFVSLNLAGVEPSGFFRYKVEHFRLANLDEENPVVFVIENIELEEDLPCKYPVKMQIDQDGVYATSALMTWEDGNVDEIRARSFMLATQAEGEFEWDTVTPNPIDIQYRFENLRPATSYTVQIQAVCDGENGSSLVKTIQFTTIDTLSYIFDMKEGMVEYFPEDFGNYRAALNEELQPVSSDWATGWEIGHYGAGHTDLSLDLGKNANTWLVLPNLESNHEAQIDARISLFNAKNDGGDWVEAPKNHDTLWLFASRTGNFDKAAEREIVGAIPLDSLKFGVEEETIGEGEEAMVFSGPKFNERVFDYAVEDGGRYAFAFYIPGLGANSDPDAEGVQNNTLGINKIELTYRTIFYPAVSNLHNENLSKTSVSVVWNSKADSCVFIYKARAAEKADTIITKENRVDLTNLQPGTAYQYQVYGIYGITPGKISRTVYFNTIAECMAPTGFVILDTFWDGARIAIKSDEHRLIHIKSVGPSGVEYTYVDQIVSWEGRRDTTRLRGLSINGIGYPYELRIRNLCAPGDSSAWTPTLTFHTAPYPQIGTPTNLRAAYNAADQSAVLSWTPGVNNDYTFVYYKKAEASRYDTTGTVMNSYTLRSLDKDAVYLWSLQAAYDTYLYGARTGEEQFQTVGNKAEKYAGSLRIRVNNRRLVVENPDSRYIKQINLYDVSGRKLKTYPVNDRGNVLLNTELKQGMVFVEVVGSENERAILKAVVM